MVLVMAQGGSKNNNKRSMGQVKKLWMEMEDRGDWPTDSLRGQDVCAHHFGDKYLKSLIVDKGHNGTCSYCGRQDIVRDMYDFGEDIAWKVGLYFVDPASAGLMLAKTFYDDGEVIPGFRQFGDFIAPIENTVYDSTMEMMLDLGLYTENDELNNDIASIFTTDTWISKDIYEEDQTVHLVILWEKFCKEVTHSRRFTFLATPHYEGYDNILKSLHRIIIQQGLCKTLRKGTVLYRARKVDDSNKKYAFKDITAAPDMEAYPNRMSPAGISMFYASFDKTTPMRECVGDGSSAMIVGKFKTKITLHVIDLTMIPTTSFWMDGWQENKFLHQFNEEVTKPVNPEDKNYLQYVPTQIITEFFRYMFRDSKGHCVDGLIYGSSKTKERNIVLFCNQRDSVRYFDADVKIEVYESKEVWRQKK